MTSLNYLIDDRAMSISSDVRFDPLLENIILYVIWSKYLSENFCGFVSFSYNSEYNVSKRQGKFDLFFKYIHEFDIYLRDRGVYIFITCCNY